MCKSQEVFFLTAGIQTWWLELEQPCWTRSLWNGEQSNKIEGAWVAWKLWLPYETLTDSCLQRNEPLASEPLLAYIFCHSAAEWNPRNPEPEQNFLLEIINRPRVPGRRLVKVREVRPLGAPGGGELRTHASSNSALSEGQRAHGKQTGAWSILYGTGHFLAEFSAFPNADPYFWGPESAPPCC